MSDRLHFYAGHGIWFHEATEPDEHGTSLLTCRPKDVDLPADVQAQLGAAMLRSSLALGHQPDADEMVELIRAIDLAVYPWGEPGVLPTDAGDYWWAQKGAAAVPCKLIDYGNGETYWQGDGNGETYWQGDHPEFSGSFTPEDMVAMDDPDAPQTLRKRWSQKVPDGR